ncbi:MAG: trehalase family glycosidase [Ferruginibacter sp.]
MSHLLYMEELEELFVDVQMQRVFADQKTFTDCVPRFSVSKILEDYRVKKNSPGFELKKFIGEHFVIPDTTESGSKQKERIDIEQHIHSLWDTLTTRSTNANDTLMELPFEYVVPGGRFRELFYWDSYFTMLGLQASGRYDLIEAMVDNFAYLIDLRGYIPNGTRTYLLSRSQPPFFSLMVELLAEIKGPEVWLKYIEQLRGEYQFWMRGCDLMEHGQTTEQRVVKIGDDYLNRYWDNMDTPRPEGYFEDVAIAAKAAQEPALLYRNIRAACESGWDFSSRWFKDAATIESICITDMAPVDLNSLIYHLEMSLAGTYRLLNDSEIAGWYLTKAAKRKALINTVFWNEEKSTYCDYIISSGMPSSALTMAMAYPLFTGIATPQQAQMVLEKMEKEFLCEGGLVTSHNISGQQWDAPNGWAPLQWIGYKAALAYDNKKLALQIADAWTGNVKKVYDETGKMMEKYNVMNTRVEAGGGEYPNQDGFGWTNGVYLKMKKNYNLI